MWEDEDQDHPGPARSPGPGRADGDPTEDGEGGGGESGPADVPAARRRGVRRPQPKLDPQRLTSERGLPALPALFENVRFGGRGHEAQDLQLLLHRMENWAHRLYPRLQFQEFLEKVERLGQKKEVQTCLKRIRLDMPLLQQDAEAETAPEPPVFSHPDPFSRSSPSDDPPGPVGSAPAPPLTEEQQRRVELNRQRALERKLARRRQAGGRDQRASVTSGDQEEEQNPEPPAAAAGAAPAPPRPEEEEEEGGAGPGAGPDPGPDSGPSSCGED